MCLHYTFLHYNEYNFFFEIQSKKLTLLLIYSSQLFYSIDNHSLYGSTLVGRLYFM